MKKAPHFSKQLLIVDQIAVSLFLFYTLTDREREPVRWSFGIFCAIKVRGRKISEKLAPSFPPS